MIKSIVYILVKQIARKLISYCYVFPIPCHPNQIPLLLSITHVESPTKPKPTSTIPLKPQTLPYPATEANVSKLEQYLNDAFKYTVFNRSPPVPAMTGPTAHIHLKPNALP